MAGQEAAVASIAAMVEYRATATARKPTPAVRRPFRLVTASLVGGLTLFGGLAAANALPGSVQGVASDMFDQVGVSVPAPSSNAGDHPNVGGKSGITSNVVPQVNSGSERGFVAHEAEHGGYEQRRWQRRRRSRPTPATDTATRASRTPKVGTRRPMATMATVLRSTRGTAATTESRTRSRTTALRRTLRREFPGVRFRRAVRRPGRTLPARRSARSRS